MTQLLETLAAYFCLSRPSYIQIGTTDADFTRALREAAVDLAGTHYFLLDHGDAADAEALGPNTVARLSLSQCVDAVGRLVATANGGVILAIVDAERAAETLEALAAVLTAGNVQGLILPAGSMTQPVADGVRAEPPSASTKLAELGYQSLAEADVVEAAASERPPARDKYRAFIHGAFARSRPLAVMRQTLALRRENHALEQKMATTRHWCRVLPVNLSAPGSKRPFYASIVAQPDIDDPTTAETLILMTAHDVPRAFDTARALLRRADAPASVVVIQSAGGDTPAQDVARVLGAFCYDYFVVVAETVLAGHQWLARAKARLDAEDAGVILLNDGRDSAAESEFCVVRQRFCAGLYAGRPFFNGYSSFAAALCEIIARARREHALARAVDSVVMDTAPGKKSREPTAERCVNRADRARLNSRLGLGALAPAEIGLAPAAPRVQAAAQHSGLDWNNSAVIDATTLHQPDALPATRETVVLMPAVDLERALATAERLKARAGVEATLLILHDVARDGFIATINAAFKRLSAEFVVYLAEDALPGVNWLKTALARIKAENKAVLAFNCGKWHGRLAAFGLVRKGWAERLYGGDLFFPGYKAHAADDELSVLARASDRYIYSPESVLMENDPNKNYANKPPDDRNLFLQRFKAGFDGIVAFDKLRREAPRYYLTLDD